MILLTMLGVLLSGALLTLPIWVRFLNPGNIPNFITKLTVNKKLYFGLLFLGLLLTFTDGLFFVAKPGTAYSLQYLWGGDKAITSQGIKLQWFGRPIPISFEIAIQDTIGDVHPQEEIYYRKAERREFSDAIKADIATSLVVSINYQDEETFLATADKNRSEGKLVHARIIPIYDQVLKNTCKLQTAQEYISGASAQFDFYLKDQLQHGMYLTEEIDVEEDTESVIGDSVKRTVTTKAGSGTMRTVKKYKIRRDKAGQPMRDEGNSLSRYGLTVQQAAITQVDWEDAFDDRLDQQKQQVAATQLKKAEAEKEYYTKLSEIQIGEKNKVIEQKKLEKEQIQLTIAAETAVAVSKYKAEEERNLLVAAKTSAERTRVDGDAAAYKNRQMVAAGLTPQERADWDYKTKVGVAAALAGPAGLGANVTTIVGGSGDGKGDGDALLTKLITAKMAEQMLGVKGNNP